MENTDHKNGEKTQKKVNLIHDADLSKSTSFSVWTRDSSVLLGGFFLTVFLVAYFWWPLAKSELTEIDWDGPWWLDIDWLLIGIFAFMSFTIIARANLKTDVLLVFVGFCGGLAIEAWGTQTNLWFYYTSERPPLWIIPAWPIANLSIDRITRTLDFFLKKFSKERDMEKTLKVSYWVIFVSFMALMFFFVAPTFDKSYTIFSLVLCTAITLTPTNYRHAVLVFLAGAGLGYFLELWGTTRRCWTYYTFATPPLFAVLAHGMASVAFWRAALIIKIIWNRLRTLIPIPRLK